MSVSLKKLEDDDAKWVPSESDLGPAMRAILPRHRLFVIACLDSGVKIDFTRAARIAGYARGKPGDSTLRVRGHRLAHSPKIQAAILEESQKRLQAGTMAATGLLMKIVADPKEETKDRLKAAQMVLDRGGLGSVTVHKVDVTHTDNRIEKVAKIVELARLMGQDPKQLLGSLADVTDADFEMVDKLKEVKVDGKQSEVGSAGEKSEPGADAVRAGVRGDSGGGDAQHPEGERGGGQCGEAG